MADIRVASRYVKSLLGLAVEQKVLEAVHKDMRVVSDLCESSREFALMLKSPVIRHEIKREILRKIFSRKVNKLTMAIIDILTIKNREPLLPAIAAEFHNAYNEHMGIGKASVTTTVAMDKAFRSSVETLEKKLSSKKEVEGSEKVDQDLIGGFILNVGDLQIDASIKGKLRALSLKFNENYYVKDF